MLYENVLNMVDRAHAERVSSLSRALACSAGLPKEQCSLIADAALYHDIGKIGVPRAILESSAPLTDEQRSIMEKHVQYGLSILKIQDRPEMQMAKQVIATHHERWDGSGYPNRLQGEEIPLSGRIVALSDVFDALIFSRPYKPAWSIERAAEYIRKGSGTMFDPGLIRPFLEAIDSIFGLPASLQSSRDGPR